MELVFKAKVTGNASKVFEVETTSGVSKRVLHDCTFIEGPSKGDIVPGARTLFNSQGETKQPVQKGDEVTLYGTRLEDERGAVYFWSISTETVKATANELDKKFGVVAKTAEKIGLEE
jgi:hypothetical protein